MGHDHDHAHDDDLNTFYLDQLFTIAVCGALALVTCLWWWNGTMKLFIVEKYHLLVLSGGLLLLALVVIRAVALWFSVQEPRAVPIHVHDHDHGHEHHHHHHHDHGVPGHVHEHGPACGHDHGVTPAPAAAPAAPASVSGHDHDHDHSHGWAPWRYVVLLLPVVLYFLNLPNQGFSADLGDRLRGLSLNAPTSIRSTGTAEIGFAQLQQAALTPESRDWYEGKTVTLTGQYSGDDPKRFTLVRFKIACCAADAVPLNAVIMIDPNATERIDPDKYRKQWIEVKGRVHFFQRPGSNEFITALILYPSKDEPLSKIVQIISPPANPFLN